MKGATSTAVGAVSVGKRCGTGIRGMKRYVGEPGDSIAMWHAARRSA